MPSEDTKAKIRKLRKRTVGSQGATVPQCLMPEMTRIIGMSLIASSNPNGFIEGARQEALKFKSTEILKELVESLLAPEAVLSKDKNGPGLTRIHAALFAAHKHLQDMGELP